MGKIVSLIIPIYNQEKYLARCLDSVLCQTYKNLDIILINDGSTDSSLAICEDYAKKDERIRVITKKNGGVSSSRNLGIKESKGNYLFFLDADDAIDNNVIENLVKNTSDNSLVSCRMKKVFDTKSLEVSRNDSYSNSNAILSIIDGDMQGFVWGYLFSKKKCAGMCFCEETSYLEDIIFLVDYLKKNQKDTIKFLPKTQGVYIYYQNPTSMTNKTTGIDKKLEQIDKALKIIDAKTKNEYKQYVEDKKAFLFKSELIRADKKTVKRMLDLYTLSYNGNNKRLKRFVEIFNTKKINRVYGCILFHRIARKIRYK